MLNPVWLNTFKVLIETGHFTKTAQLLHMTQPGVSQHIQKLESQLDCALLARHAKSFEITEQGQKVYDYAVNLTEEENALRQSLHDDNEVAGQINIACSGSIATFIYPLFLERQSQYPELTIKLEAAPNKKIADGVLNNLYDIGIATRLDDNPLLSKVRLGNEALCLVFAKSYTETEITLAALNKIGFINHPDGHGYANRVLAKNFGAEFTSVENIRESGYVNQLSQILLPVSLGLGFTVLPKSAVDSFAQKDLLRLYKAPNPVYDELTLISKKFKPLPKRYTWFVKKLKQLYADKT